MRSSLLLLPLLLFLGAGSVAVDAYAAAAENYFGQVLANPNIQGNWQGVLNSTVGKLRLVLRVSRAEDGRLKATMDSPDQGVADLQIDTFTFKDSYLHFEMKAIQASFDGGISRDGTEIAGEFKQ